MTTTNNNAPATRSQASSLASILEAAKPQLKRLTAKYVNVDRLIGLALEIVKRPELARCTPASVVEFCKKCAEWKTDRIGPGGVWPVPYGDKLTAIPDWRFLIQKAKDAKAIKHATAEEVFSNDEFRYSRGMNPDLVHNPVLSNRGEFAAAYCIYTLPDGTKDFHVMLAEEIEHVRNLAPSKNSPAWKNYPGQMRVKTCVRRAMKIFEGASPELTAILEADTAAMGYLEAESIVREPVKMPVALPEGQPAAEPSQQSAERQEQPESHQQEEAREPSQNAEASEVRGRVEKVSIKSSPADAKKAWTKYGIMVGGEWYGTFDEKVGEAAQYLKSSGEEASMLWRQDGQYKTAVSIGPVKSGKADPENDGRDGGPDTGDLMT